MSSFVAALTGLKNVLRAAAVRPVRHSGDIRLAGSDDGTMVSRIHAADIVSVVEASIERPEPGMVMNVADDLPSTRYEVSVTWRLKRVLAGQAFFVCPSFALRVRVMRLLSHWNLSTSKT